MKKVWLVEFCDEGVTHVYSSKGIAFMEIVREWTYYKKDYEFSNEEYAKGIQCLVERDYIEDVAYMWEVEIDEGV